MQTTPSPQTAEAVTDGSRSGAREGAPSAAEALLRMHRDGVLAARFPQFTSLLAELDGPALVQAGRLLSRVAPEEVLTHHPGTPVLTVAVTGHGTLGSLQAPLTAELARHGLLLRPHLTPFDSYVFELSDPASALYAARADIVAWVLDPMVVFDEVPTPWCCADVERVLEAKLRLVEELAARFAEHGRGTLVLNTIALPRRFTAQLIDHRSRAALGAAWRSANARLLGLGERHPAVTVLDLDPILADGVPAEDVRLSVYAKQYLSPELLARYARELGHLARYAAGRVRKVLAVDLDNTLWGGVLGDDGLDGIEVSAGYRGEAFRGVQRVVKQLGSQGVLVIAVSKNDPDPVSEVLREHPEMTLRDEDFVRVVANWNPKPDNVRQTAQLLNLGVDSFVFADDSPYECGLMRHELPEVVVLPLSDEPATHVDRLLRDGWFDVRELTSEDVARRDRYRQESARGDFLNTFHSLDDYLRELGVEVRIGSVTEADLGRLSQLTLRTNQFNLTTVRLPLPELRAVVAQPGSTVLAIRSRDRFGDNGLVGAAFIRREADTAHLDNVVLSCRVFSRGIEQACLAAILTALRDGGVKAVHGRYRATAKNAGVRDFLPRYGFTAVTDDAQGATYRHDLVDIVEVPGHVHLTADLEGLRQ